MSNETINTLKEEITLLKEENKSSKLLFTEVQKMAHLGTWDFNFHTKKGRWSEETFKILGVTKKNVTPSLQAFLSFIHPDDIADVNKVINQSHIDLNDYKFYCRIIQPSGKIKYISGKGIFQLDKDKKPFHLFGILHDITEMKKMQNIACLSELLGQENERERIAKELHDGLGQVLFGINLKLAAIEHSLEKTNKPLHNKISDINATVLDTLLEIRSISHNLSSHSLTKYGLNESLKTICTSTKNLKLSFETNLETTLEKPVEIILYRTTQELISNIIRHSNATKATVSLLKTKNNVFLTVVDNGVGFDKRHVKQSHSGLGLANIRNRIQLVCGNCAISNNNPGKGARIEICIPLNNN